MSAERLIETISEGRLRVEVWLKGDDPGRYSQYLLRFYKTKETGEMAENARDFTMDEVAVLPELHDRAYRAIRMLANQAYQSTLP